MSNVLVTGAFGQIGSELVPILRNRYGKENVFALDIREVDNSVVNDGPTVIGDATNAEFLARTIKENKIDTIYHLCSLISAVGEKKPKEAWRVNIKSLKIILDLAQENNIKVFWPSSIAVAGPTTPRDPMPQRTILEPTTMYGVTKVTGENLCNYYSYRYKTDIRSVRYPGLISHKAPPGGGTTDFASEIFYSAIKGEKFKCFLSEDSMLPMMFMV